MTLKEMRQKRAELTDELRALIDSADAEKREMTEDEESRWESLEAEVAELKDKIKKQENMNARREMLDAEKADLGKAEDAGEEKRVKAEEAAARIRSAEPEGFRNLGDFMGAIFRVSKGATDVRVQQMKDATAGGYLVPDKFMSEILAVEPTDAIVASRARILSNSVPPDAEVKIPALDQGTNDYGGVTITHGGESDVMTETNAVFRQITLKPHKLTALTYVSNEIMNNAMGFSAFMSGLIRDAMTDATETDYIAGDGVNKALGFTNSPCRIDIGRTTANQIAFADITGMLARRLMRGAGNWVWIASQATIPQLANLGDGTNNILVTNAAAAMPQTLMGLPIIFNDRFPGLGTRGDLCLVDLSKYIIANGSGPSMMVSDQFRFDRDEVAIRLTFRTDGQAWLNQPITPKGSTDTRSPFIILN